MYNTIQELLERAERMALTFPKLSEKQLISILREANDRLNSITQAQRMLNNSAILKQIEMYYALECLFLEAGIHAAIKRKETPEHKPETVLEMYLTIVRHFAQLAQNLVDTLAGYKWNN